MCNSSLPFENCKAILEYKLDIIQEQLRVNVRFSLNTPDIQVLAAWPTRLGSVRTHCPEPSPRALL